MSIRKKEKMKKKRRTLRVRNSLKKYKNPRVVVFRSLKHIYAQIIDDVVGHTLASSSSIAVKNSVGDKKKVAYAIGLALAKQATEKDISAVVFDRGPFRYHGRVKSFAEGLREGGVSF